MHIERDLKLRPIINASGTVTRLGGAIMSPNVVHALCDAATVSLPLDELQGVASRHISQHTGGESALVTAGAAAGLMLGTAAILARFNLAKMAILPDTSSMRNEFIVARSHRTGYDHAVRMAGAKLVEVGIDEIAAGSGVRQAEPWEYEAAANSRTAGVFYTLNSLSQPPLSQVVEIAHRCDLPVLVDAAAQLPPVSNLREVCATGADLVVFSGGKAIGGPQSSGILCGRRDLVGSAFLQMMDNDEHFEIWQPPTEFVDKTELAGIPRHGIGRVAKAAKEHIVAILTALDEFVARDFEKERTTQVEWLRTIEQRLENFAVRTELILSGSPSLIVRLDETKIGRTAMQVCESLRQGDPRIFVGHELLKRGGLTIVPACMQANDVKIVGQRLAEALK